MFLNRWDLKDVVTLDGTDDAPAEAGAYQSKLEAIPAEKLPRDEDGFPVFDLALIGVGDDGHSKFTQRHSSFQFHPCQSSTTNPLHSITLLFLSRNVTLSRFALPQP